MKYIPNHSDRQGEMLREMGLDSIDQLFEVIPENLRLKRLLNVKPPLDEFSLLKQLKKAQSAQPVEDTSFLGAGAYRRFIPSLIPSLTSRAEFLTCYTPYQPEVSQGTLQAMFEFQTLLSQLTGMDMANASMYEAASAVAEAVRMALRIKPKKQKVAYSAGLHPEYVETLQSYLAFQKIECVEIPLTKEGEIDLKALEKALDDQTNCFIFQVVNFFGVIEDQGKIAQILTGKDCLNLSVLSDMSVLGLIKPPGDYGADIVVGEGQSLGLPLGYGGPYLGVFASKKKYMRQMPGRLSGMSLDADGNRAFCLTLATREQHIRREKATSNICTNQALCALWVTIYLSLLGKKGMAKLARINLAKAHYAMNKLEDLKGFRIRHLKPHYNEFVLELPVDAKTYLAKLREDAILGGIALSRFNREDNDAVLVCVTETNSRREIDLLVEASKEFIS